MQIEGLTNLGIQPADLGWAVAQVVGTSHIAGVTGNQCYGTNVNSSYSPGLTVKGIGFGISITWNYTIDSNNQICLNYSLSLSYGLPAPTLSNTVRVGGNASLVNGSATATTAQQDGFVVGDTSYNTQPGGTVQYVTPITILCQMGYAWNGAYYVVAWNEYTSIVWYSSGGGNKWNPPPGTLN